MYEIAYILDGARVASFKHPGPIKTLREIAEDGIRRHRAEHACILNLKDETAEIWPRPT